MHSLVYYAVPKAVDLLAASLTWQTTAMTSQWRGCQRLWRMTRAAACHHEPVTSHRRKKRLLVEVVMGMFGNCRTLVCIQMIALIAQSVRQDMIYSHSNAHGRSSTKRIQNTRAGYKHALCFWSWLQAQDDDVLVSPLNLAGEKKKSVNWMTLNCHGVIK